ncbi:hypothetical protein J6590_008489 [Homalodisca vitripennis]|nr:hypothetical protein J6590_008489 [Homalodisca vitripennis]
MTTANVCLTHGPVSTSAGRARVRGVWCVPAVSHAQTRFIEDAALNCVTLYRLVLISHVGPVTGELSLPLWRGGGGGGQMSPLTRRNSCRVPAVIAWRGTRALALPGPPHGRAHIKPDGSHACLIASRCGTVRVAYSRRAAKPGSRLRPHNLHLGVRLWVNVGVDGDGSHAGLIASRCGTVRVAYSRHAAKPGSRLRPHNLYLGARL